MLSSKLSRRSTPSDLYGKGFSDRIAKESGSVKKTKAQMKPLSFDSIHDDIAHPLSSLRSCSEYNRIRLDGEQEDRHSESSSSSFWSKFLFWKKSKGKSATETAEAFVESENRRRSRLCEETITVKPECENVIPFTRAASIVPTPNRRNNSGDSTYSLLSLYSRQSTGSAGYNSGTRISAASTYRGEVSLMDETTEMLDVLFGIRATPGEPGITGGVKSKYPMEIELQDLNLRRNNGLVPNRRLFSRQPSLRPSTVGDGSSVRGENMDDLLDEVDVDSDGESARQRDEVAFPRVLSWRSASSGGTRSRTNSLQQSPVVTARSSFSSFSRSNSISSGFSRTNSGTVSNASLDDVPPRADTPGSVTSLSSIMSMLRSDTISIPTVILLLIEKVYRIRHLLIDQHQDEAFYEAVRIQPFSSGSYLRGMLIGGLCNMFFHLGLLVYWPQTALVTSSEHTFGEIQLDPVEELVVPSGSVVTLTSAQQWVEWVVYGYLIVIVALHYLQLPIRLHIHIKCFASSRTVEVDNAVATLRSLFVSDEWLLNRAIGWVTDWFSLVGILLGELYLWISYWVSGGLSDPLCGVITSVTTTIVLAFSIRVFIALVFCYSMHDPAVLAEARRRGLSKWDLEVLPTFVFSKSEEVNNQEGCSICLSPFCLGEMLISLPCDKRHSFHANCIRQWLHRQNSCPLCQKHV